MFGVRCTPHPFLSSNSQLCQRGAARNVAELQAVLHHRQPLQQAPAPLAHVLRIRVEAVSPVVGCRRPFEVALLL